MTAPASLIPVPRGKVCLLLRTDHENRLGLQRGKGWLRATANARRGDKTPAPGTAAPTLGDSTSSN